jgi:hypothetical protein
MKTLSLILATLALIACSKPADPTGLYVISDSTYVTRYDIQSSGGARISGVLNFAGTRFSWNTAGTWEMEGKTLVVSAPQPDHFWSEGRITQHKFTIEPNGDLITLQCEEFDAGLRAVKQ